ncbi:MAG: hypothetical protein HKN91_09235 [Acidimicrobiia bacterium]|nr:hypothetical protein [Acidimicrobiia bacterium]
MPTVFALHETWFTDERPGFDWGFTFDASTALLIGLAIVVAIVWRLIGKAWRKPELAFLEPLGRLAPYVPRLLAIHAGVSLLAQSYGGTYLAPGLDLPAGAFGTLLGILEGVVGVWLITGFRIRPAAWLLIVAGPLGMVGYGPVPILERLDLLGIAAFLIILPPSDETAGAVHPSPQLVATSLMVLRLMVGGSLVILAFTEKLARPDLAYAFLDDFPAFNILEALGLGVSDEVFVRMAGATELLFGLLIISGALPQLAVIVAGIPFNATLFFLGSSELIGHLPIYGAMLALLIYGSNRMYAPAVPKFTGLPIRSLFARRSGQGWAAT